MRPFRFAVQAMELHDPAKIADTARRVEELGYDELYSYDHFGTVDPFAPLLVAATATLRLRVGPLVLNNEFHQPALLARTAATVDRMTSGRLVLGLGTGYQQSEHDAIGLELRRPRERVDRFAESLAALRTLLDRDSNGADLEGAHHTIHVDKLGVKPVQQRIPFLIGGHGRRVVALAAKYADIYQFTGLTHADDGTPQPGGFSVEQVESRHHWLTEDAGDRNEHIERSVLVQGTAVGGGDESVFENLSRRFGLTRDVVDDIPFVIVGSVEHVVDKLERHRERFGISHYVIRDPEGFAPIVDLLRGR